MNTNNFTVKFSAKTGGFYPSFVSYPSLPDDLIDVDVDYYRLLLEAGGEIIADKKGYPILKPTLPPSLEELRAAMVVTKVKAMQNLKKAGKLNAVLDLMDTLPRDNDVRILWDFSETLHRTDATLVKVCKEQLKLTDLQIDAIFTQP
jgi:hypothetical protein